MIPADKNDTSLQASETKKRNTEIDKTKTKADENLKAKEEAEAKAEAELKAKEEAEAKAKAEAELKAKEEAEAKARAESEAQAKNQQQQVTTNTNTVKTDFANCTELRKEYPHGVASNHPAYTTKMDRDHDGYACETN